MIADYQGTAQISGMNRLGRGWTFIAPSATGYIMNWHPDLSKTKLWEFIANRTGSGITLASDLSTNPYGGIRGINYHDGSSSMASTWPASAIPIAVIGTNPANAGFVIDPKDRVIYIGESLYVGDGGIDSNCRDVWNNVNFWIAYASRYGSTFSDLLIEDETAAGGGMPAPWDDWWGANKVTSFDNSYAK